MNRLTRSEKVVLQLSDIDFEREIIMNGYDIIQRICKDIKMGQLNVNIKQLSNAIGMSRQTFYKKLKKPETFQVSEISSLFLALKKFKNMGQFD